MNHVSACSLALSLALVVGSARAQDMPAGRTTPAATLGRPVAAYPAAAVTILPASASVMDHVIVRAQSLDQPPPPPGLAPAPVPAPAPALGPPVGVAPPIGASPFPATPDERYNCGVVTEQPAGHSWLHPFQNFGEGCRNLFTGAGGAAAGRCPFQSDHCFDGMISPVTNPFLFEDPRALTEVRPIFMFQQTPSSNWIFHGGDIAYAGIQARVAVTERLSFVMSEIGAVWIEPHVHTAGFGDHVGISELRIGPKYTFYRCEDSGTVAAAGLNFDIPIGDSKVFQDTGDLSLEPYISVGQTFGSSGYGAFNFMGTVGFSVGVDNKRSDFVWTSLHLDFNVLRANLIYPFVELNDFYYTSAGKATDLGFEGRDLFNFGSMGVSGDNTLAMAVGARYKIRGDNIQAGLAYEFPLGGHRDLIDWRITFDMIFRY
jgi:hypothetical protein